MKIGETLKGIRKGKGLTQKQVEEKIGITQTYLSQIESGEKEPSGVMLRKLCKYYGTPHQIVVWQSLEEKDVPKLKRKLFADLKPAVDGLISQIISSKIKKVK